MYSNQMLLRYGKRMQLDNQSSCAFYYVLLFLHFNIESKREMFHEKEKKSMIQQNNARFIAIDEHK